MQYWSWNEKEMNFGCFIFSNFLTVPPDYDDGCDGDNLVSTVASNPASLTPSQTQATSAAALLQSLASQGGGPLGTLAGSQGTNM